ncbi:cobalt-precorrin-5B (C(1))-methyltransferase CbiD [Phosphitispora sp. TUW77]|uniref:cobalt-precorrin-5B (C(1))-methyltransferase CbiD n=1 Tax=Phosphitispora sp. TUW77 TaxID=3152361 RepID=UPI003AB629E3
MGADEELRHGITTGASAAAAAQAAVIMLYRQKVIETAQITNPQGRIITVPIENVFMETGKAVAEVIKDGGDDPDVTNGLKIVVKAAGYGLQGVTITGGYGVGMVTKPGLQIPVGQPAINPVPKSMIAEAVRNYVPKGKGVIIEVSVPGGIEAARKTLNPKLGIEGGISILGTTGIVEPMSEDAFKKSLVPQIDQAIAYGYSTICLTPGRLGEKWAGKLGIPAEAVAQMSNFVGYMLKESVRLGIKNVILVGHHSKLTKIAAGCFHTHNKVSDARLETLAAYAGLKGAGPPVIGSLLEANTSEEALDILKKNDLIQVMDMVAAKAASRAMEHVFGELRVGVVLFTMAGEVLAADANALEIGREMKWPI